MQWHGLCDHSHCWMAERKRHSPWWDYGVQIQLFNFVNFQHLVLFILCACVIHQQNQKVLKSVLSPRQWMKTQCKQNHRNTREFKEKLREYDYALLFWYHYLNLGIIYTHDMQQCLMKTMIGSVLLNIMWRLGNSGYTCGMVMWFVWNVYYYSLQSRGSNQGKMRI